MTKVSKVYFSFSLVCDGFGGAGVAAAGVGRPDLGDGGQRVGLLVGVVQIVGIPEVGGVAIAHRSEMRRPGLRCARGVAVRAGVRVGHRRSADHRSAPPFRPPPLYPPLTP